MTDLVYTSSTSTPAVEDLINQVALLTAQVKQLQIENEQLKTRILNSTEK